MDVIFSPKIGFVSTTGAIKGQRDWQDNRNNLPRATLIDGKRHPPEGRCPDLFRDDNPVGSPRKSVVVVLAGGNGRLGVDQCDFPLNQ